MKKQIRGFLISFLISVPIFLLIGKYLSGPKENELQVKFEEERVLLFENKSSLNVARENDCNFISKYGSTFINWTGEIKYLDEDRIVIVSDVNGIEVQYKIYNWMFDNDGNYRNIKNEDIDIGDDVYFSFHPVQSESDEDECFDETSFTEAGALRAPEFIADIFQISKNTWEISQEKIKNIENKHKEVLAEKKRVKEEKKRIDKINSGKFSNKEDFSEWLNHNRSFKYAYKTGPFKKLFEFSEDNKFLFRIRDRYGEFDDDYYGTYSIKTANYFEDGEKYYYIDLDYEDSKWNTYKKGYLVYKSKKLVEPTMGAGETYITDKYGFKKKYVGFLANRMHKYLPTDKTFHLSNRYGNY